MQQNRTTVTVKTPWGELRVPVGIPVREVFKERRSPEGLAYVGALVNNDVVSLSFPLEVDCEVEPLTRADSHGFRIYRHTACLLLAKTVKELFPRAHFSVEHSLGPGFYCSFDIEGRTHPRPTDPNYGITEEQVVSIEQAMRELVGKDVPIERRKIAFGEALEQFEKNQQWDKYNLLSFSNPPKVVIHVCEGFWDLSHGPLADRTGAVDLFKLVPYRPGFVILFPERENPLELPAFEPQPNLFQIFQEHKEWGRILGVSTVGRLNEIIANGEIGDFIKIAEAFHEKKIAQLADQICERRGQVKWVLIAGPSSSGKTTFTKRLAVQLRVNGLRLVTISLDDYFVNREDTPKDENGQPDFEHIETIDLKLLNEHLERLDRGEEVELPHFNFEKGEREWRGNKLQIAPDEMVLLEGIHALNPRLTYAVPAEHKFKIYISALTQLNLDYNNRISTTDNRLMRRMLRDHQFRGNSALTTLEMWPSVRRGEKRWIFPYQQEANVAFNSALDYELAVLKPLVEPLLVEIKPFHRQYGEARRLMQFLSSFLAVPDRFVPPTSLLREFIGRSSFRY